MKRKAGRSVNSPVMVSARSSGTPALSSVEISCVKKSTSRRRPLPNWGSLISKLAPLGATLTYIGVSPCLRSSRAISFSSSPTRLPLRTFPSEATALKKKVAIRIPG